MLISLKNKIETAIYIYMYIYLFTLAGIRPFKIQFEENGGRKDAHDETRPHETMIRRSLGVVADGIVVIKVMAPWVCPGICLGTPRHMSRHA